MNGNVALAAKPLPPPAKDEKLPSVPPHPDEESWHSTPPPPPKIMSEGEGEVTRDPSRPIRPIDTSSSLSALDAGLGSAPLTPISPGNSQVSLSSSNDAKKKSNPLTDLIETEKAYVDLLSGIIRKVAAAWSRSNLPPPELDTMFRSIEGIYKANRSLAAKLKEIGSNPSSPKMLGDLLMRWIDDLETPYTTYSNKYCSGFDTWDPVVSNPRLRTTLAMFSSSNPPPIPSSSHPHPSEPVFWTLDELFLLPKGRLKYYKKLYSRLLKSTTPGRSDHKLLSGALEKLDRLVDTLDARAEIKLGDVQSPKQMSTPPVETEDEVVIDLRSRDSTAPVPSRVAESTPSSEHRDSGSTHGSGSLSSGRRSNDTPSEARTSRTSTSTLSTPVSDLERRLSTERTMDIFTMTPKSVRLQMNPPSLTYTRELRVSADVVITVTPRATGVEIIHGQGHVFILTDLLLVCERMAPQDRAQRSADGADMWLLYPPLAGKHLRVAPLPDTENCLSVTILRKETLILRATSRAARDQLVSDFRDCIDTGASVTGSKNQGPPPPVPTLPSMEMPRSFDRNQPPPGSNDPDYSNSSVNAPSRATSAGSMSSSQWSSDRGGATVLDRSTSNASQQQGLARLAMSPEPFLPPPGHPMGPPRSSSAAPGPSFGPGQIVNGPSFRPGQVMPQSAFGPGQVMPQGSFGPGQVLPPTAGQIRAPQPFAQGLAVPPASDVQIKSAPLDGSFAQSMSQGPPRHPYGPPGAPPNSAGLPPRPPSEPSYEGGLRKASSSRSLASQYERGPPNGAMPPMPAYPGDLPPPPRPGFLPRNNSTTSLPTMSSTGPGTPQLRPILPSVGMRAASTIGSFQDPSPPGSPVEETPQHTGPVVSTVSAQFKCKVFLKQHHAQWKSLGSAKLKLYREDPTNIKQLVVEADSKDKAILISTIVLTDGVERVGKTGVAIELSDKGQRTGIVYMIQLRNEKSAGGLFDSLIAGSDRSNLR